MSLTKTLVSELLNSLKNNDGEEKLAAIIARLEALEEKAKKTIIEEEHLDRIEKYGCLNYNLIIGGTRYFLKPIVVNTLDSNDSSNVVSKTILALVEQKSCCMAANEDETNCCNQPCAFCPYRTGRIPKQRPDNDHTHAPYVVHQNSAPINLKKKPCEGCDCGRANNITLDIEDIGK